MNQNDSTTPPARLTPALEAPVIPIQLLKQHILQEGMTILHRWLAANAPPEIQEICHSIDWAMSYYQRWLCLEGQVHYLDNQEAPALFLQALNVLEGLKQSNDL